MPQARLRPAPAAARCATGEPNRSRTGHSRCTSALPLSSRVSGRPARKSWT